MNISTEEITTIQAELKKLGLFYQETTGKWCQQTQQAYAAFCSRFHPKLFASEQHVQQPANLSEIPEGLITSTEDEQLVITEVTLPLSNVVKSETPTPEEKVQVTDPFPG